MTLVAIIQFNLLPQAEITNNYDGAREKGAIFMMLAGVVR